LRLTADALNHLLRQNTWAAEKLRPHAGKNIRISVTPFSSTLTVDEAGEFGLAATDAPIDAEIQLGAGAALRLLFQPDLIGNAVTLQGDMELASAVGKVLQGLHWDVEEDLSRVVGDIPAHQLTQTGDRIRQELGRKITSLAGMFAEYWLEEQPLIAKQRHLEQFSRDVDTLRDDTERLAKRLEALEQKR
jgi:ubiquinone biosynthesis accessory factor UbiJ